MKKIKKLCYYWELKWLYFSIYSNIKLAKILRNSYLDILSSMFFRLSLLDQKFKLKSKNYHAFVQEVSNG